MTFSTSTMAASLGFGVFLLIGPAAHHPSAQAPKPSVAIFDGKTLSGWHKPQGVPADYRGGKWDVIDGTLVGDQDPPGMGGFLVTSSSSTSASTSPPTAASSCAWGRTARTIS